MIINEGECIICDSVEEYRELFDLVNEEGYMCWTGNKLIYDKGDRGLRWTPGDGPFPKCLCVTNKYAAADLLGHGTILKKSYGDSGIVYAVRKFHDVMLERGLAAEVEVSDLL